MWTDVFDVGTSDTCKGLCPSMPCISQSVKENNRGGGLPGGGHDGGQRGGHVVAAHPPAGRRRVGSGRELRRPAAEGRASRVPARPSGRALRRVRAPAPPCSLSRSPAPLQPRARAPPRPRVCVRVTMRLPARSGSGAGGRGPPPTSAAPSCTGGILDLLRTRCVRLGSGRRNIYGQNAMTFRRLHVGKTSKRSEKR